MSEHPRFCGVLCKLLNTWGLLFSPGLGPRFVPHLRSLNVVAPVVLPPAITGGSTFWASGTGGPLTWCSSARAWRRTGFWRW